ncbi:cyclase family protein [Desulfovibrio inopinatus]|uniref:cyclase family protein n=1 Tax=Desulfovibrio inopinatus TaxID=102109 RepID=UPI000409EC67|nr:cyclase family protein [Desulfovibrio inopinatus]
MELLYKLFEKVRNWGKWGDSDELGTLNYIQKSDVLNASRLVLTGDIFPLAIELASNGPQKGNYGRINPQLYMLNTGRDSTSYFPHGFGYADDLITMPLQAGTHWDALGHIFDRGKMWNGYGAKEISSNGAQKNSISAIHGKVAGRGVLLDIARFKECEALEIGYAITIEDIEACIEFQGETSHVGRGDIVLIRTGTLEQARDNNWSGFVEDDAPGLSLWMCEWLHNRNVAAIAIDTWGLEVKPHEIEGAFQPLHQALIPNMGMLVGEIFDLSELAANCHRDKRYEFFFVAPPLPIRGAVGSPINPYAIK